ncbi:MAG: hypothetical protein GY862_15575 [Gammaproteobacteria bacterium]|nr:hypothetical protein [Gammaproteobacteria bacterium]
MAQAVKNIKTDCYSPSNPNGNITQAVMDSMEGECGKNPLPSIEDTVNEHQTLKKPALYTKMNGKLPVKELKRVMSLTSFVTYHINNSSAAPFAKLANAPTLLKDYKAEFKKTPAQKFPIDELEGSTGRLDAPSWWTFQESGVPPLSNDPETYAQEMALGKRERERIKKDGMAVEITLTATELGESLYKPSALDGFEENTLFRPETSGLDYGRTHPVHAKLQSRPEIISPSKQYHAMNAANVSARGIS